MVYVSDMIFKKLVSNSWQEYPVRHLYDFVILKQSDPRLPTFHFFFESHSRTSFTSCSHDETSLFPCVSFNSPTPKPSLYLL